MASPKTNTIIDILMAVAFIISAISGLVLKFILPRGSGRLGGIFLRLLRENWLVMHDISSIILIILVILHLILHWKWILNIPKYFKSCKNQKNIRKLER